VQYEIARGKLNQRNFQKSLNSLNHEIEDRIQQKQEKKNRKKQKKNTNVYKNLLASKIIGTNSGKNIVKVLKITFLEFNLRQKRFTKYSNFA
jgi:hypothetical protein